MIISTLTDKKIQLIATGSGKVNEFLGACEKFLTDHSLTYNIFIPFQTSHPLYVADHDERLDYLMRILMNPTASILWALRGGSGTTTLLPYFNQLQPPTHQWIIGFSDITALHLMAYKLWDWVTVHGPTLNYCNQTLPLSYWQPTLDLIQKGKLETNINDLIPLNEAAHHCGVITGHLVGGNMSLVQSSIGTFWQLDGYQKVLFLEDINEPPYRVAERLTHFQQAGLLTGVRAILLGDFNTMLPNADHDTLMQFVFTSFAQKTNIPVFANLPVGHATRNVPLLHNYPCTVKGGAVGHFSQTFDEATLLR